MRRITKKAPWYTSIRDWLVWPLLTTASAASMFWYLVDADGVPIPFWICLLLQIVAWGTVFNIWRWYRQRHGGTVFSYVFLVAAETCFAALIITTSVFNSVKPVTPDVRQYTALTSAVENRDIAQVQAILAYDKQPDYAPPAPPGCNSDMACFYERKKPPLYMAVNFHNIPIAAALLAHGASASSNDSEMDPFLLAAGLGDIPMMRLLLQHGANVRDTYGNSPALIASIENDRISAVSFLLRNGANPSTADTPYPSANSETALGFAKAGHYSKIIALLKHAGAKQLSSLSLPYRLSNP